MFYPNEQAGCVFYLPNKPGGVFYLPNEQAGCVFYLPNKPGGVFYLPNKPGGVFYLPNEQAHDACSTEANKQAACSTCAPTH